MINSIFTSILPVVRKQKDRVLHTRFRLKAESSLLTHCKDKESHKPARSYKRLGSSCREELLGQCGVYKWSLAWGAPDNIGVLSTNQRAGEESF